MRGRPEPAPRPPAPALRISAPHFCAGVVLRDQRAVMAAPIVQYMIGWWREHIEGCCESKRWRVEEC
jgi:hypothetical protein